MRTGNPTNPLVVRTDGWGSGKFGAPRGTHPGGAKKFHDGLDVQVEPGELIHSIRSSRSTTRTQEICRGQACSKRTN